MKIIHSGLGKKAISIFFLRSIEESVLGRKSIIIEESIINRSFFNIYLTFVLHGPPLIESMKRGTEELMQGRKVSNCSIKSFKTQLCYFIGS